MYILSNESDQLIHGNDNQGDWFELYMKVTHPDNAEDVKADVTADLKLLSTKGNGNLFAVGILLANTFKSIYKNFV
jgi:hypothetical protein